jgi:hypothetical protein
MIPGILTGRSLKSNTIGMKIIIEIKTGKIRIILKEGDFVRDELVFLEDQNISEKLWPYIDDLLRRNKISIEEIEKMEVDSDLEDTYTSRRIAEAAANTFNWIKNSQL